MYSVRTFNFRGLLIYAHDTSNCNAPVDQLEFIYICKASGKDLVSSFPDLRVRIPREAREGRGTPSVSSTFADFWSMHSLLAMAIFLLTR